MKGVEDDTSDNLEKVWCFLENVRDPLNPESGCYPDVTWSEKDGRYWSSLACFNSPDIEGGVKRRVEEKRVDNFDVVLNERIINEDTVVVEEITSTTSTTTTTTEKIPIPVFERQSDDEFEDVLNTIFQSA